MAKFYRKQVEIEAIKYSGSDFDFEYLCIFLGYRPRFLCTKDAITDVYIKTSTGEEIICAGDYVIKDVNGECYPCKTEIFVETYLPVPDTFLDRLVIERNELKEKTEKLCAFARTDNAVFNAIDAEMRGLLFEQAVTMKEYLEILENRISILKR